jgi:hypothetical protein
VESESAAPPPPPGILEGAQIFSGLQRLSQNPAERLKQLHHLRSRAAQAWLALPAAGCSAALEGELWKATEALAFFFRSQEPPSPEDALLPQVRKALRERPASGSVCAALLFLGQLGEEAGRLFPAASPELKIRLLPLLLSGGIESTAAECQRLEAVMDQILAYLPELQGEARDRFLLQLRSCHSLVPFYFVESDTPRLAQKRSSLLEALYDWPGLKTPWEFAGPIPGNRRIKLGILAQDFDARSETFALLPVFEHLDRARFETILLSLEGRNTATETYCASRADKAILLPKELPAMVSAIRGLDLDLLLFGNNLSSALHKFDAALALHRLARVQVNFVCSPITSGLPHLDWFLQGKDCEAGPETGGRYSERLALLPGSGFCFGFTGRDESPGRIWTRAELGLKKTDVVFISGANCFKLGRAVRDLWSRILAAVPGSTLLLYPFGPAWSKVYPEAQFLQSMLADFRRHDVAADRLVVLGALKNIQEIRSLLRCGDVYLDAFPYSGASSLQDPLDVGLPLVVLEGHELRFRQGAALLREAGLEPLVARDPASYLDLAVRLGRDAGFRSRAASQVRAAMSAIPPCRDGKAYAAQVASVFEGLVADWNRGAQVRGGDSR